MRVEMFTVFDYLLMLQLRAGIDVCQVAQSLDVTASTIERRIRDICHMLGACNLDEAIKRFFDDELALGIMCLAATPLSPTGFHLAQVVAIVLPFDIVPSGQLWNLWLANAWHTAVYDRVWANDQAQMALLSKAAQRHHLHDVITRKVRRLRHLQQREATHGSATEPKDRIEIEDLDHDIARLQSELLHLDTYAHDQGNS